jgi:hypothetical protein
VPRNGRCGGHGHHDRVQEHDGQQHAAGEDHTGDPNPAGVRRGVAVPRGQGGGVSMCRDINGSGAGN